MSQYCPPIKYTVFKGTDREFTGNKAEIAEHFGISVEVYRSRVRKGYSLEEAIDYKAENKNKAPVITVFKDTDREFTGTVYEIAKHFEIRYEFILQRIKNGFSVEEAIDIPLKSFKQNNLHYEGVHGNLKEICKHFNKNYLEVYNKMKHCHSLWWSIETTTKPYEEGG